MDGKSGISNFNTEYKRNAGKITRAKIGINLHNGAHKYPNGAANPTHGI